MEDKLWRRLLLYNGAPRVSISRGTERSETSAPDVYNRCTSCIRRLLSTTYKLLSYRIPCSPPRTPCTPLSEVAPTPTVVTDLLKTHSVIKQMFANSFSDLLPNHFLVHCKKNYLGGEGGLFTRSSPYHRIHSYLYRYFKHDFVKSLRDNCFLQFFGL